MGLIILSVRLIMMPWLESSPRDFFLADFESVGTILLYFYQNCIVLMLLMALRCSFSAPWPMGPATATITGVIVVMAAVHFHRSFAFCIRNNFSQFLNAVKSRFSEKHSYNRE